MLKYLRFTLLALHFQEISAKAWWKKPLSRSRLNGTIKWNCYSRIIYGVKVWKYFVVGQIKSKSWTFVTKIVNFGSINGGSFVTWYVFGVRNFFSTSSNTRTGGPLRVSCPRLLVQCIRRYPPYRRPFLHPQHGNASLPWWQPPKSRWEDNIKIDFQNVGFGSMDWIELAEDRGSWRARVNWLMDLRVP
jgi:hypothetical protein